MYLGRCVAVAINGGRDSMKDNNPTLDDYTSIKTYEDACEVLGIKPMWSAWYHTEGDSVEYETNMTPLHIEALMKLETISKALRDGWKPTYGDYCWMPTLPMGKRVIANFCKYGDDTNGKLYQQTKEKAEYFGSQFISLWAQYVSDL